MRLGNLRDNKSLGEGLHEARLFYGPGYRLYYLREGNTLIVLLTGGDKGSQTQDIRNARQLARAWRQQTED
jgi:putative addiction module killer protein